MAEKKIAAVGHENFKEIIDKQVYYVDKTMLIHDIIKSGSKVNLITRPRRFGKTLNLSMLKYFLDVTEKDNAYIFDGLKISEYYKEFEALRNAYPVISLSMKSGKQPDFDLALDSICKELRRQFIKYRFITEEDKIDVKLCEDFMGVYSSRKADINLFKESIKLLSECLEQYYGKKAIILIDEYDVPLENAYFCGFYDKMIGFIRSLFESALKTNDSLEFAVVTGCLRVSKESIFTGLNNFATNSILNDKYAEYFGFEEVEVRELLDYYDFGEYFDVTKKWYDGYRFGQTEVYNPWSVMNYAVRLLTETDKEPRTEWINSSSNSIIRKLVEEADAETKEVVERLMSGGSVRTRLDETVTYAELDRKKENMWNFLFFTGYLKMTDVENIDGERYYTLVIPNKEIHLCYKNIIMSYFDERKEKIDRGELFDAFINRDADKVAGIITKLMQGSISYFDNAENFYHALIIGLLTGNYNYKIKSNRESGSGRYDIALYQQDEFDNAIIIELKICEDKEGLKAGCRRALQQICDKHYTDEAEADGYTNIIKYGIAFKGKMCGAICE